MLDNKKNLEGISLVMAPFSILDVDPDALRDALADGRSIQPYVPKYDEIIAVFEGLLEPNYNEPLVLLERTNKGHDVIEAWRLSDGSVVLKHSVRANEDRPEH